MMRTEAVAVTRRPGRADRDRVLLAAGCAVFAVALAAYLIAIATHPAIAMLKGFDLQVYLDGGKLVRDKPDTLYTWQLEPGIQFTYPPIAAMLFAVLSFLPWRVVEDGFAAAGIAALVATVWIAFRTLGWPDLRARAGVTLLVAGVSLWLEPVQRTLFLGQVELLLMALVVWDMCQPAGRRVRGIAIGLAAGIKLVPLIYIGYLFLTRQFRAATVATATFAATVLAGFIVLPHASKQWWFDRYFMDASRTGFVGFGGNQALRGTLTRFAGSVAHGQVLWYVIAVLAGLAGLGAAVLLHRAGREFEALMTCALTGLLISPISWDHHWVWVAPILAVLVHWALRKPWLWVLIALTTAAFAAWPQWWRSSAGLLQGGLIWYAPATGFASGDNPAYVEYHWHGLQLLAGNLYVLVGCVLFALALAFAVAEARRTNSWPMPR